MSYFHLFEKVHCRRNHDHSGNLVSELPLTGQPETDPASHGAAHEDIVVIAESVQDGSSSPIQSPRSTFPLDSPHTVRGDEPYLDKGEVIVQTQFSDV